MDIENSSGDICRVCRCESTPDRPLFHPCICTGSIKFIHQDCLTQWMKYSRKEFCELCGYHFSFAPIYSPDMPRRLPVKDLVRGLVRSATSTIKCWLHYLLVAIAWIGLVPLSAYRIYRCVSMLSKDSISSLPWSFFSLDDIFIDIFYGILVVSATLLSFVGLVWLREQIQHGGGPDWLGRDNHNHAVPPPLVPLPPPQQPPEELVSDDETSTGAAVVSSSSSSDIATASSTSLAPIDNELNERNVEVNDDRDREDEDEHEHDEVNIDEDEIGDLADPINEENNWMPMEWERAAEELTWERLLGLDGSLLFIEHVFWIISLNAMFIITFATTPYHIGYQMVQLFRLQEWLSLCHFEQLATVFIGYCFIGILFVLSHYLAVFYNCAKLKFFLGFGYVIFKVSILSVIQIGLIPLVYGWWLDICSLTMFGDSLRDRQASFHRSPGTMMFIHWLIGMVYVYYFSQLVIITGEVVRPGALWFLHHINDPDFSPIQEMIHIPIMSHFRNVVFSTILFGTNILLIVYFPIRILQYGWPSFLPYNLTQNFFEQTQEISLELLSLQIFLPSLLEQSYTRLWIKGLIQYWCEHVGDILGLRSFILGEDPLSDDNSDSSTSTMQAIDNINTNGLGAAFHALRNSREEPSLINQSYTRPKYFALRIVSLIVILGVSLIVSSLMALTLPVWIGRRLLKLYVKGFHYHVKTRVPIFLPFSLAKTSDGFKFHELYTTALGIYTFWIIGRVLHWFVHWLPKSRKDFFKVFSQWFWISINYFTVSVFLLGAIPLLFGILLEQLILIPIRTELEQTPVIYLWHTWALGLMYMKIAGCVVFIGPNWPIRVAIERAYNNGFLEMDFKAMFKDIIVPIVTVLGLVLSLPYIFTTSIVPLFVPNVIFVALLKRIIYPTLFVLSLAVMKLFFTVRYFRRLYEHIKNDKYLVGRRLVNYNHIKN